VESTSVSRWSRNPSACAKHASPNYEPRRSKGCTRDSSAGRSLSCSIGQGRCGRRGGIGHDWVSSDDDAQQPIGGRTSTRGSRPTTWGGGCGVGGVVPHSDCGQTCSWSSVARSCVSSPGAALRHTRIAFPVGMSSASIRASPRWSRERPAAEMRRW